MILLEPSGLPRVIGAMTSVALIVIALALIAIAVTLFAAAWNSRQLYARVLRLLKRVETDLKPIAHHAHNAAENVNYMTTAVRADVQRVNHLVAETTGRVEAASRHAEQRMREFDALLRVMQEEAEGLFLGSASAARGVRSGLAHLTGPAPDEVRDYPPLDIRVESRATPPTDS